MTASETPGLAARRRRRGWLTFLAALVTVVVFLPALQADFVSWDDPDMVVFNPNYRGLGWAQVAWAFTTRWYRHYHPLTWLSYGADYVLWGMDPRGYHLTNLLIHAVTGGLVFLLGRRLLVLARGEPGWEVDVGALVAALAFTLHPLRVEPVAWVTARRDVLSGVFFVGAVLAYVRAVNGARGSADATHGRSLPWLVFSVLLFVAALLSKSITMTLPAVLVVLDRYPLRRSLRDRAVWVEKLPFAILGLAAAGMAVVAVTSQDFTGLAVYGITDRLAMAAFSFAFYVWKTILPIGLSPLYEAPLRLDPFESPFVLSALAVIAITVAAILLRRRAPWLAAVWAVHVVTILPVSGLTHAGFQLAYDRYSYLPGIGWAILLGGGVAAALAGRRRAVVAAVCALAVAVLGTWAVLTRQQIAVWRDPVSIWRRAVAVDPGCVLCRSNLGAVLMLTGHLEEAGEHLRLALALRPTATDAARNLAEVLRSLGGREAEAGRFEAAVRLLSDAAALNPREPGIAAELARAREALAQTIRR